MSKFETERAELGKKIYNCKCMPVCIGEPYCNRCHNAVLEFMDEHGAGVLMGDIRINDLLSENSELRSKVYSLNTKINILRGRIEKLKEEKNE